MNPLLSWTIPIAIERCLAAIRREQLPSGGFSHSSNGVRYTTTFFAANILNCLATVPATYDRETIAQFLLAEKSEHWSFNYWARASRENRSLPYPDDLDDTFVALAALYNHDPALVDGGVLACVAKMLTAVEIVPGGPYRTWLIASDAADEWRDVDVAVNANIGYFLSLVGVTLPNLFRFVDELVRRGNLLSRYYPGVIQPIYFISRFYRGDSKLVLADVLLKLHQENSWHNPLEMAMSISALINFGCAEKVPRDAVDALIVAVCGDGFRAYAFCIDPSQDGERCVAGSPALTAAFCTEALAKYSAWHSEVGADGSDATIPQDRALAKIQAMAKAKCMSLPEDLKRLALGAIEEVATAEIVMVPYIMHAALRKRRDISMHLLDKLALANLYGWIAYSIYDDFFDGEIAGGGLGARGARDADILSAANYFLRELTLQYAALDSEIPGICAEFIKIMNIVDNANVTTAPCFAGLGSGFGPEPLADQSLGHALPALAVFMAGGYPVDSPDTSLLISFFKNYLAARQLHDDAHDWADDLARGQVNGVAARMFAMRRELGCETGNASIAELRNFFWRAALPRIVHDISDFLRAARSILAGIEAIERPALFEVLLDRLESAAARAFREQKDAIKFLELYSASA